MDFKVIVVSCPKCGKLIQTFNSTEKIDCSKCGFKIIVAENTFKKLR